MPSYAQHARFVRSKPYRYWYLIKADGAFVGDIHVTHLNEIGVFLFPHFRHAGYGSDALRLFMQRHRPLGAVPAKRVPAWLANVSPANTLAKSFFKKHGFSTVQETMRHG